MCSAPKSSMWFVWARVWTTSGTTVLVVLLMVLGLRCVSAIPTFTDEATVNVWTQLPRPDVDIPPARAYHSAAAVLSASGVPSMLVWGGHNGSAIIGDGLDEPQIVWVSSPRDGPTPTHSHHMPTTSLSRVYMWCESVSSSGGAVDRPAVHPRCYRKGQTSRHGSVGPASRLLLVQPCSSLVVSH
jgi:hypothetical protein